MTDHTKMSFRDMVEFVDQPIRFNITNQLMTTSPLHAMCTLAACVATIASVTTQTIPLAQHNIDEISSFAKELVKLIIEEMKNESEKYNIDKVTKH